MYSCLPDQLLLCSTEVKYVFKWVLFQLLPVLITTRYMSEHYLRECWARYRGHRDTQDALPWHDAFKSSIFMLNLLYIGVTQGVISTYMCGKLGESDTYYLIAHPPIKCYESAHACMMVLSTIPLVVYIIGWPFFMSAVFYFGVRKNLLQDAAFSAQYGFLFSKCAAFSLLYA